MQQSDQYRDRGMSHGQPAPQILAAFSYVRADASEHGGAESEKGTAAFLISEEQTAYLIIVSWETRLVIHRGKSKAVRPSFRNTNTVNGAHTHTRLY